MELILQETVPGLGFVGDVVTVKPGYARNFLLPKKLALPATKHNVKLLEHQRKAIEVKKAEQEKSATELKNRLEAVSISVEHAASENGKLFGSVTVTELQKALEEQGFDIHRNLFVLAAPIKMVGEHNFKIKLHQTVSADIKVTVVAKLSEEKSETAVEDEITQPVEESVAEEAVQETADATEN